MLNLLKLLFNPITFYVGEGGAPAVDPAPAPAVDPAPAPAVDPAPAPAVDPTPAGHFYDTFEDQAVKDFAILKGFENPEAAVNGFKNLEKLSGVPADMLVKLPGTDGTPEQWGEVWNQLGRPATAEDYKLEVPEGQSPDLSKVAGAKMHELGLTSDQAQNFTKWWNSVQAETEVQNVKDYNQSVIDDTAVLKSEWGMNNDKNIQLAKQVAISLDFDGKTIDALEKVMGFGNVMRMMKNIGAKLGEDSFVSGGANAPTGISMEPEVAKARIEELRKDKAWTKSYIDGDVAKRKEMHDLHKYAYPPE